MGSHSPAAGGGKPLVFNSPTVFNATLRFRLNWRGNFRSLDALIEAVLLDPRLMNTSWDELLSKLRADADYRKAFAAIDPGDLKPAHVLDALAAYQRSLLTPNARFDQYLRGQRDAITDEEKRGYHLFKSYGCIACHQQPVSEIWGLSRSAVPKGECHRSRPWTLHHHPR
jgi:cytochrome c peroxidase